MNRVPKSEITKLKPCGTEAVDYVVCDWQLRRYHSEAEYQRLQKWFRGQGCPEHGVWLDDYERWLRRGMPGGEL